MNHRGLQTPSWPSPQAVLHDINNTSDTRHDVFPTMGYLLPVVIYLGLLLLVGLVANSVVFFVYLRKVPSSPSRLNLLAMACFDFLTCVVSIPGEILDVCFTFNFPRDILCKVLFTFTNVFFIASAMTVLLEALNRYGKTCNTLGNQVTLRMARKRLVGVCLAASMLSALTPVVYSSREGDTAVGGAAKGNACAVGTSHGPAAIVYSSLLALSVLSASLTLLWLYLLIWRCVVRTATQCATPDPSSYSEGVNIHKTVKNAGSVHTLKSLNRSDTADDQESSKRPPASSRSDISRGYDLEDEDFSDALSKERLAARQNRRKRSSQSGGVDAGSANATTATRATKFSGSTTSEVNKYTSVLHQIRSGYLDTSIRQTTLMIFVITLTFVMSYVPHVAVVLMEATSLPLHTSQRSDANTVIHHLFIRSYCLNAASNPFIYGFSNFRFRKACKELICGGILCRCMKCKGESDDESKGGMTVGDPRQIAFPLSSH